MSAPTALDTEGLAQFVRPEHLEPAAIDSRRHAFASHPAKMTVIEGFLHEPVAETLGRFLDDGAVFADSYGLYSQAAEHVRADDFEGAAEDDKLFRFGTMVAVDPAQGLSDETFTYMQFRRALQSELFCRYFEAITGLELAVSDDFVPHRMEAGDYLREHDDRGRGRRLAIVTYLSPGWTTDLGGALILVDHHGGEHLVRAEFNSVVAFATDDHKHHYVERVQEAAGDRARLTIGGWYHDPPGTEPA